MHGVNVQCSYLQRLPASHERTKAVAHMVGRFTVGDSLHQPKAILRAVDAKLFVVGNVITAILKGCLDTQFVLFAGCQII